jgi:hypothetical protein
MTIMTLAVECSLVAVECNPMKLVRNFVCYIKGSMDYKYKYLIANGVLFITFFLFQLQSMYRMMLDMKRKMWPHSKHAQLCPLLMQVKNTLMLFLLMKYF